MPCNFLLGAQNENFTLIDIFIYIQIFWSFVMGQLSYWETMWFLWGFVWKHFFFLDESIAKFSLKLISSHHKERILLV